MNYTINSFRVMKISTQLLLAVAGILLIALGILSICKPSPTLSTIIGIGSIVLGVAYLVIVFLLSKVQKQIGTVGRAIGIGKNEKEEVKE